MVMRNSCVNFAQGHGLISKLKRADFEVFPILSIVFWRSS